MTASQHRDRLGFVYLAHDRARSRPIRLRELAPAGAERQGLAVATDGTQREEFLERGRRLQALDAVEEVLELPEGCFWVSEDPPGESFAHWTAVVGVGQAVGWLAHTLARWHAAGSGHGGLEPGLLRLQSSGCGLVLLDPLGEREGDLEALQRLLKLQDLPRRPLLWAAEARDLPDLSAFLELLEWSPTVALRPRRSSPARPARDCLSGHRGWVRSLAVARGGLYSGSEDHYLRCWTDEREPLYQGAWVCGLAGSREHLACVTQDGQLRLDGRIVLQNTLPVLDFSPDERLLAVGQRGGLVKLLDGKGQELRTLAPHPESVQGVAFSPDARLLAVAAGDLHLHLWDVRGRLLERRAGQQAVIRCLAFLPDGRLVTGGGERQILLWDLYSSADPQILKAHQSAVRCLAADPLGRGFVSGSTDSRVLWWPLESLHPRLLGEHLGEVSALVFEPDGRWLASAGQDQIVRIWTVG